MLYIYRNMLCHLMQQKQNIAIHFRQYLECYSYQFFKKTSISKCSSPRRAFLGSDTSFLTENMWSKAGKDGRAGLYLKIKLLKYLAMKWILLAVTLPWTFPWTRLLVFPHSIFWKRHPMQSSEKIAALLSFFFNDPVLKVILSVITFIFTVSLCQDSLKWGGRPTQACYPNHSVVGEIFFLHRRWEQRKYWW